MTFPFPDRDFPFIETTSWPFRQMAAIEFQAAKILYEVVSQHGLSRYYTQRRSDSNNSHHWDVVL